MQALLLLVTPSQVILHFLAHLYFSQRTPFLSEPEKEETG